MDRRQKMKAAAAVSLLLVMMMMANGKQVAETGVTEAQMRQFGRVREGRVVLVTLTRGPLSVKFINWGARIVQLHLPNALGSTSDVVLGFDTLRGYTNETADPYFGAIVGRVANRIAGASFVLDNVRYNLSQNEGKNTLHGGKVGFDKVVWDTAIKVDDLDGSQYVQFTYHSYDGEQGFPGDVNVKVTYRLKHNMEMVVDMKAVVGNKSTPLNLAQHTYWNLGGHNSGNILNNTIEIAGDRITKVDENLIPTGELEEVTGTPYDFTRPREIGSQIDAVKGGYDVNYALSWGSSRRVQVGQEQLHLAAKVWEPRSRRSMELYTNQVGMQFYTSNGMSGIVGKGGAVYGNHAAMCLETQGFPDAVHHPNFPSVIVPAHGHYRHLMLFRFSIF